MIFVYIFAALVAGFILVQFILVTGMKRKKGKAAPDLNGKFGKLIRNEKQVVFYFFSPGCRACISMTPVIDNLPRRIKNIIKIDISQNIHHARSFGVFGTPSLVLVRSGIISEFLVGPQQKDKLIKILNQE